MIIDSLNCAQRYFAVHPLFEKAFEYIRSVDPATIDNGKADIDGDNLKAVFINKTGMTSAESIQKFECHDKYIDIQVCMGGIESIGWKSRGSCLAQKADYNPDKDVTYFNDAPDTYFGLTAGQFAIFFPEDVHAPLIGDEGIKKLVIKVKI